jgi:hypothetical protein
MRREAKAREAKAREATGNDVFFIYKTLQQLF